MAFQSKNASSGLQLVGVGEYIRRFNEERLEKTENNDLQKVDQEIRCLLTVQAKTAHPISGRDQDRLSHLVW